jgi:hypothetical protein
MFVAARKTTRRFFVSAVRHLNWVNFGDIPMSSFRHGMPEPRFTWKSPDASLQAWMPAIPAGMTDALA